jgi:ATP-dependent DNA helicase RecG
MISLAELPGVGPKRVTLLRRLGVETVTDLLLLEPRRYEDRTQIVSAAQAAAMGEGLIEATVLRHDHFFYRHERVLKIIVHDGSAPVALVCFGRPFLSRTFPVGRHLRIYGQFQFNHGEIQCSLFDAENASQPYRPVLEPVYPRTEGLTQQFLRQTIRNALKSEEAMNTLRREFPPVPDEIARQRNLLSLPAALHGLHQPSSIAERDRSRFTLVFQEFFLYQQQVALRVQARRDGERRKRRQATESYVSALRRNLPFQLTADQETVLQEILHDLAQPWAMSRLLQGDVGSGKTLVALLAAAHTAECREQTAFMVPTELLAHQHGINLTRLVAGTGIKVTLITGGLSPAERRERAEAVASGAAHVVVGTHALFSEDLRWQALGLVIVDEQHRFGVNQRQALLQRPAPPDLLMMSATPIPRSLALTAFGDSDVSTIRTVPPGRQPVITRLARMGNEERAYTFVRGELEKGHQAYIVYPAIEPGGPRDLRSAEEMAPQLAERFAPYPVGVVHSRLDTTARAERMEQFNQGSIAVLVATSVVEVGVDVPNATVMVVEHAEQFGLAALHQLRGRVGRGPGQSWCILVYQEPLTEQGRERLKVLYKSTDGFIIAEEDLRIRGPGDLTGFRQSGYLQLRIGDIRRDMNVMLMTRDDLREWIAEGAVLGKMDTVAHSNTDGKQ